MIFGSSTTKTALPRSAYATGSLCQTAQAGRREAEVASSEMSLTTPETKIVGREIRLAARPAGEPDTNDFQLARREIVQPAEGQILVRTTWMSVDPYMRGRMDAGES
jgi:hypothetical protein